ncbi:MAG: ATP-dependent Clp protease adapter ClpS [Arachnia sp.]
MSEQGRPSTGTGTAVMDAPQQAPDLASQWVTIVWDDPVNLMSYVAYVFMEYFKYPRTKAEKLMLEVHTHGKAVVSTGNRESMERDVMAMQNYTLWATMERA